MASASGGAGPGTPKNNGGLAAVSPDAAPEALFSPLLANHLPIITKRVSLLREPTHGAKSGLAT
jgi:hypothetical protein